MAVFVKKIFPYTLIILFSCSKDAAIPEGKDFGGTVTPVGPFVPLTVGSFWIYDYFLQDTNGVETYLDRDTMSIINDTILNGKTYAVFDGSYEYKCNNYTSFRRDSLGYLIDTTGWIYFSSTNFTDTLENLSDSTRFFFYKMTHKDSIVSVPAGVFQTFDYERILHYYLDIRPTQHCHNFYSNGVGIIKTQWKYYIAYSYNVAKPVNYYIAP